MDSVLIIGVGQFGSHIARRMSELRCEVMAVDINEDRINDILPYVTNAQIGDSTSVDFMRSLGIRNYDVCIITIGSSFQTSLETTALAKEFGAPVVVSRASNDVQKKFLLRNGADEVINPEKQIAEWAAIRYTSDHIRDYIKLDDDHAIFEVTVPDGWIGRTIGNIDIRKKYGINILAIRINGQMTLQITPDSELNGDMTLLVFGDRKAIQKCFRI